MDKMQSDSIPCVLLLQTDENFTELATLDLKTAGYSAISVTDIHQGWHYLAQLQPAMLVIDNNLAKQPGLKLCQQLRGSGSRIVILMLLKEETVEGRVACLEAGADDYLVKPYKKEEFLQLVRFYLQPKVDNKEQLCFSELTLDLSTRRLLRQDRAIDLTMKEYELMKYLMSNPHKVLTREDILENVWGYDYRGESNVIEVYIRYLRLKIESEGQKRLIQTVRGVGYVLRES